jgi:membrane protease subunit (stomatin/prohibitin family)
VGLLDNLKNQIGNQLGSQFIEIIQWLDDSNDAMVYRFPVYNQEIKMGAQLTVRENQAALFINEGKAADLFGPGRHELSTQNLPILTTLRGWKYGFQSPFKAEVYFFNTRLFTDLKWGTTNPVMMRDAEFGMIRLRAFGTYAMKIAEPKTFFATIVGTQGLTTTEEITGQLRSTILSKLSDAIAEAKVSALDIASKYDELSGNGRQILAPEFSSFGLDLSKFFIENVSLPEEVEAAIDQRTKLGVLGDKMGQYTQLQAADAMKIAAANPGGAAGAGIGIGAGIAMGGMMGGALANAGAAGQGMGGGMAPPPPPPAPGFAAPRWSLTVDGKTYGPYSDDAVKGMVASGQVAPATLAWKPGAAGWAPLSTFEEFAAAGGSAQAPPPPPPAR